MDVARRNKMLIILVYKDARQTRTTSLLKVQHVLLSDVTWYPLAHLQL